VLEGNIVGALGQYLKYLPPEVAAPFLALVQYGDDMKNNNSQNTKLNPSDIESTVQYIVNVNAPIQGDIQQGKGNINHNQLSASEQEGRTVLHFLSKNLVKIITTLIAGVILALILTALGIKP
jgi:hypothetical protein